MYRLNSYLKLLLCGGLLIQFSATGLHASGTKGSTSVSTPWYQEYVGLSVMDTEGNELGKSESISLSPIGNGKAKLVVHLNPNNESPHEKMLVPLEYVGYFKDEGQMKLLQPVDDIRAHLTMRDKTVTEQSKEEFAWQEFLRPWNWESMIQQYITNDSQT